MSGRHRKPNPTTRHLAAVSASGAFAVVPFIANQPVAMAETSVADVTPLVPTVDWSGVIACESGGNPHATNPSSTASGLYQMLDSTWKANGGSQFASRAKYASEAEQTQIANRLYASEGLTPWASSRSCWNGKTSGGSTHTVSSHESDSSEHSSEHESSHESHRSSHHHSSSHSSRRHHHGDGGSSNGNDNGSHNSGSSNDAVPSSSGPIVETADTAPASTPALPVDTTPATGIGDYVIKPGDTLSSIATIHQETWQALYGANRSAIGPNPNLIQPGQHLSVQTITPPEPGTVPSSGSGGSPVVGGSGQQVTISLTGYSFGDNQGSNNATISMPVLHQTAGGTGTFDDPITAASPGHAGSTEFPKGTKFYIPSIKRYIIVEDSGATKESQKHLDVYVGGEGTSAKDPGGCESKITGTVAAELNPPRGREVVAGPIYQNGTCRV